jgi:DNA-binding transcriptional LysR family regulator
MNNVDWDGFRYFLAAAEAGSLSAAAKQLSSNQPTVGRHIDALEASLETRLFQRSVKGLNLTQEGQYIFEQSQLILESVLKIQRAISGDKESVSGTVRLSIPEGLGLEVFAAALNDLYKQYPKIKLVLNVTSNAVNLTQGEADIAIRLFRPEEANLVVKKLGEMKMGLFASKQYSLDRGLPENELDLFNHRTITYGDQLSILAENQWLLKHSDDSLCTLSSDSTAARLKATVSGAGISILPQIFKLTNPQLVPLLKYAPLPEHTAWLVYHKDLRHVGRIRAVVDFVSRHLGNVLL